LGYFASFVKFSFYMCGFRSVGIKVTASKPYVVSGFKDLQMGFLDSLFGSKVSNPAVLSAMEKYAKETSDENAADLWQKFLKGKVLLATTADGKEGYKKAKSAREAVALPFTTVSNEKGDTLLAVFVDNAALEAFSPTTPFVVASAEDAVIIAAGKNFNGMMLNPNTPNAVDLRIWQHTVFIEKLAEANKLLALASKLARNGAHSDAEGVLKAAIACSQRDPGPQHPFTAELNV
jgi:hypothetical protein